MATEAKYFPLISTVIERDSRAAASISRFVRGKILGDDKLVAAIAESHHVAEIDTNDPHMYRDFKGDKHKAKFQVSQFPIYANRILHNNYVDGSVNCYSQNPFKTVYFSLNRI